MRMLFFGVIPRREIPFSLGMLLEANDQRFPDQKKIVVEDQRV